jgi:DNA polymerase V
MPYDDGNTTGFPSPATIYLEAVIDLAEILDLRRPSRYPVRVIGGTLPARGIVERDIVTVDSALERSPGRICVYKTRPMRCCRSGRSLCEALKAGI